MFYTGLVVNNYDESLSGVVEVYIPSLMTQQKKNSPEAINKEIKNKFKIVNKNTVTMDTVKTTQMNTFPAHPFNLIEQNHGIQLIPEVGDEVLLFFKDNNHDVCYYLYANAYKKGKVMDYGKLIEDENSSKDPEKIIDHKVLLLTKSNHIICLNDTKEKNGIFIKASGKHTFKMESNDDFSGIKTLSENGHEITIDDTNEGIVIKTTKGHSIFLDDKEGGINIKTKSDYRMTLDDNNKLIQIVTPNGIGLEFDDNNNKLRIAAQDIESTAKNNIIEEADNEISMKSKSKIKLETNDFEETINNNLKTTVKNKTSLDTNDLDIKVKNKTSLDTNELSIEVKGNCKLDCKGNIEIGSSSGIKIESKATLDINSKAPTTIKSDASMNIESTAPCVIKSTATATVEANMINLGEGAASSLIKGPEFLQLFNTHMHTCPPLGGASSPPIVPVMEPMCCSLFVKTK